VLPPTVKLRKGDMEFVQLIIASRARAEWAPAELHHVANLARCMADVERITNELAKEGDMALSGRGTAVVNPKHFLLETLSRRAVVLTRLLQIDALARFGNRETTWKKETLARDTKAKLARAEEDDLLATPTRLN
jgi:hypothetical protein